MLKRLGFGLLKGVGIGALLGAALHFGLGATPLDGVLAYLAYMGIGASAGAVAGKPPWGERFAWIELALRSLVGVGVGAALYFGATKALGIHVDLGPLGAGALSSLPLVVGPAIGGIYGTLVELDNDGKTGDPPPAKKIRVEDIDVGEEAEAEVERQRKSEGKRGKAG